ncbi:MAG: alkyl hydroperoxide reductase [Elusimicrobia bacterium RIFCSPLOWO2_02_FULL_39_32]|nr:MAG: alkyl hydroperoxide reductase [Elusimicrobia bacterium RIFCSPHIGHO2_02_FULL_39_36]OGR92768.1 MAG: alkyl hydroperoxide reductase [Elusimicrobia bacterium RIFCSPLOWO2_02_FULL_39_32]OGR99553.1 MAG: alkyl hydroperoxide reductase [Elusimicrobia bacterium RIFCSPLOWO2_12_FULL_39_28]
MKTKELDAEELKEGDAAPDFELKDQDGKSVKLSDFKEKKVVLYFYPKDDTPGCTKEACSFRDHVGAFNDQDAVILGVSLDKADSHKKFISKFQLNFPLLCDEEAKVSKLFGVYKKKNLYARLFWGIERTTFVIDEQGKLKKVFRKVKVDGHTEEVLAALKG